MKDAITKQTLETLRYRKERLERKAGQMERLLSGQTKSLLPLLRDGEGHYSEEKTQALVVDLTETLELHQRFSRYSMRKADTPLSDFPPALTEKELRFFRSFLYCLLRFSEDPPPQYFNLKGTFGDLLVLTRGIMEYQEREDFYLDTVFRKIFGPPTWRWMDLLRESVTGVPAEDMASQADIDAVEKRYPEEAAEAKELEELEKDDPTYWQDYLEAYSEPLEDWEIEAEEQERQAVERWLENFPEKEAFCRAYESWLSEYFDMGFTRWLDARIGSMLDVYLYREGGSSFLADETYFAAYALLDQAVKQLRELLDDEA